MPRYVILHHQMPADAVRKSHWDLMLEVGDALRTWAMESELQTESQIFAVQLADHRRAYLSYQGPISGNRGTVAQWDSGTYEFVEESADRIVISVDGVRCRGTLTLTRLSAELQAADDAQRWSVSLRKS